MSQLSKLKIIDDPSNSLFDIHNFLLKIWTENNVDQLYQNFFLSYLDTLNEEEGKKEILKEYQRMLEHRSKYDRIRELTKLRENIFEKIMNNIGSEKDLQFICIKLDELRKVNLHLAEQILKFQTYFNRKKQFINPLMKGYNKIFIKMNDDVEKLKRTFLNQHIHFSVGFDPFLLYHYEISQRAMLSDKNSSIVEKLFSLNISYAYRLIKAKNSMLKYLSLPSTSSEQLYFINEPSKYQRIVPNLQIIEEKNEFQNEQSIPSSRKIREEKASAKIADKGIKRLKVVSKKSVSPKKDRKSGSLETIAKPLHLPEIKPSSLKNSNVTTKPKSLSVPTKKEQILRHRNQSSQIDSYRRNMLLMHSYQPQNDEEEYKRPEKNINYRISKKWNLISPLRSSPEIEDNFITQKQYSSRKHKKPLYKRKKHYRELPSQMEEQEEYQRRKEYFRQMSHSTKKDAFQSENENEKPYFLRNKKSQKSQLSPIKKRFVPQNYDQSQKNYKEQKLKTENQEYYCPNYRKKYGKKYSQHYAKRIVRNEDSLSYSQGNSQSDYLEKSQSSEYTERQRSSLQKRSAKQNKTSHYRIQTPEKYKQQNKNQRNPNENRKMAQYLEGQGNAKKIRKYLPKDQKAYNNEKRRKKHNPQNQFLNRQTELKKYHNASRISRKNSHENPQSNKYRQNSNLHSSEQEEKLKGKLNAQNQYQKNSRINDEKNESREKGQRSEKKQEIQKQEKGNNPEKSSKESQFKKQKKKNDNYNQKTFQQPSKNFGTNHEKTNMKSQNEIWQNKQLSNQQNEESVPKRNSKQKNSQKQIQQNEEFKKNTSEENDIEDQNHSKDRYENEKHAEKDERKERKDQNKQKYHEKKKESDSKKKEYSQNQREKNSRNSQKGKNSENPQISENHKKPKESRISQYDEKKSSEKEKLNSSSKVQSIISHNKSNEEKKTITMKPGNIKISELFLYIKKKQVQEKYRKTFEIQGWKNEFLERQSYLTQFFYGNEIAIFALTFPLNDGDFRIGYWGPLENCSEKINIALFRKHLQCLQKFTSLNYIYLSKINSFENIEDFGFVPYLDTLRRKRSLPLTVEKSQVPLFFASSFVNVSLKQPQNDVSVFYSQEIQVFKYDKTKASPIALSIQEPEQENTQNTHYIKNISSIGKANNIIENLEFDGFAYSKDMNFEEINIFCSLWQSQMKSGFLSENAYLIANSKLTYKKESKKICEIDLKKNDFSVYFGKGFQNVHEFAEKLDKKNSNTNVKAGVKCFSKQLYGKIKSQSEELSCYGNWDITYFWHDELQGRVKHSLTECQLFEQNFFVILRKQPDLLYAFEVTSADYIYQ